MISPPPSSKMLKFAAVCALVTVVTTLAVHVLPQLWADVDTFEERLELSHNPIYMARLWVVLVHCGLVVVSMFGIAALKFRDSPALIGLGFLSFVVFAFSEMLRTSLVLFALNRKWRVGYSEAKDESTRASLRGTIEAFGGINDALFFIFYIAFLLGILCYGLVLIGSRGFDGKLGWLFLLWTALSVPALIDTFTGTESLGRFFGWVGPFFLPAARAIVGIWLWSKSNAIASAITTNHRKDSPT
jgi:hypothetical protein